MILFSSGLLLGIIGLALALVGAIIAGNAMTARPPKSAPSGGGLYIDLDKARLGLWLVGGGTAVQILGALQAAYTLL